MATGAEEVPKRLKKALIRTKKVSPCHRYWSYPDRRVFPGSGGPRSTRTGPPSRRTARKYPTKLYFYVKIRGEYLLEIGTAASNDGQGLVVEQMHHPGYIQPPEMGTGSAEDGPQVAVPQRTMLTEPAGSLSLPGQAETIDLGPGLKREDDEDGGRGD